MFEKYCQDRPTNKTLHTATTAVTYFCNVHLILYIIIEEPVLDSIIHVHVTLLIG